MTDELKQDNEPQTTTVEGSIGAPLDFSKRKIAIGFPSSDYVNVEFHNALIQLITQTAQFVPLGLTNAVSSRIAVNRNIIVENARSLGATDILWIDSDSVFPVQSLMHLLTHDKDIVCATTCRRKGNDRSPVAVPADLASVKPNQELVDMKQIGFPFMLTKMSVFDKLDELGLAPDKAYFAEPSRNMMRKQGWDITGDDAIVGEDEYWCYLVRKAGFQIWCDMGLSMQIGHVGTKTYYIENPQVPAGEAKVDIAL